MLWVTITMVVMRFELEQQLLNLEGGDGIESGARFVEQQYFRIDRQRAGNAEPLLLAAGERSCRLAQLVFHFGPEGGATQAAFHRFFEHRALVDAIDAETVGDVVEDGFREGIRLLEHHADAAAQIGDVHGQNVLAVQRRSPSTRVFRSVSFMRFMVRRKVDLPQPEGPMKAVTLLAGMAMVMSCSAWKVP